MWQPFQQINEARPAPPNALSPFASNIVPLTKTVERAGSPARARPPRIALYSHDTMGLGHMRRNILLAQALSAAPLSANVLLISGARESGRFLLPAGVDCVTLPSLFKTSQGEYQSRCLTMSAPDLIQLRATTIRAALDAFAPDLLIVDNVPRGAMNEMEPALEALRSRRRTHCVLGLRDVLDDPDRVRSEWAARRNETAIRTWYDEVWIYGDPAIYNPIAEYGFAPDIADKVRFCGYLDPHARNQCGGACEEGPGCTFGPCLPDSRPFNLCVVGGGQDGFRLARTFADAEQPAGMTGVLVTGPFMPAFALQQLRDLAARRDDLLVFGFVEEPTMLLRRAASVVAMGGYNTVSEILAFNKPALIVPRVEPRKEQWVRAQRLSELGLVDVEHPDLLRAETLTHWFAIRRLHRRAPAISIDFHGLSRLTGWVSTLTDSPNHPEAQHEAS